METRHKNSDFSGEASEMESNHFVLGILAHVDAGKTTLSEGILYKTGAIRKAGRVDSGDAFLDTFDLEKKRGITIFSKQAEFRLGDYRCSLLDTPGHVDFSPEMERTLQILDAAILVISAPEGVNAQVRTLWSLLDHYRVPTFLFVNKMDQEGADRNRVLSALQKEFGEGCVDFSEDLSDVTMQESLAVNDEEVMTAYLDGIPVGEEAVRKMIGRREVFPVRFGSALHMEGIDELLSDLRRYLTHGTFPDAFGARVFKISRDSKGTRLTWVRMTGGVLRVKEPVGKDGGEKVDQIRIYSGNSFEMRQEVSAGEVCALTGPLQTRPGQGLGIEPDNDYKMIRPVLASTVIIPEGADREAVWRAFSALNEEEPMLQISRSEETGEISVGLMGQVQTEVLHQILLDRFGVQVGFGEGKILYRETIKRPVEGVGHFEPLRHYAEVHLLLEPGEPGSGLIFDTACSTDELAVNWQRLILTHLAEKKFKGVLTGSEITDMKITLIGGRASEKHTSGGDFRQATYRAVRQGLMMAEMRLLEPVLSFQMELPSGCIGRALTDLNRMNASFGPPAVSGETAGISGKVSAAGLGNYASDLTAYSGGRGRIVTSFAGYEPCRDADAVIEEYNYDPEADTANPSASVFCSHGAGVIVPWDQVREYMHVDTGWRPGMVRSEDRWRRDEESVLSDLDLLREDEDPLSAATIREKRKKKAESSLTFKEREKMRGAAEQELKEIFERTYGAVRNRDGSESGTLDRQDSETDGELYDQSWRDYRKSGRFGKARPGASKKQEGKGTGSPHYLLVDGYNVIFAWEELRALASKNIDAARDALIEKMSKLQSMYDGTIILVFDAYRVHGRGRSVTKTGGIYVVYTKEAETADAFIEKTVHEIAEENQVTVVSSDGLVQTIILGEGGTRISSRELQSMLKESGNILREQFRTGGEGAGKKGLSRLMEHDTRNVIRSLKDPETNGKSRS